MDIQGGTPALFGVICPSVRVPRQLQRCPSHHGKLPAPVSQSPTSTQDQHPPQGVLTLSTVCADVSLLAETVVIAAAPSIHAADVTVLDLRKKKKNDFV